MTVRVMLGKTVLVPKGTPTSLGSVIFAFAAAGVYPSIEMAQDKLCLQFQAYEPEPMSVVRYERLYQLYRKVYFALGTRSAHAIALDDVLPELRAISAEARSVACPACFVPVTKKGQ